MADAGRRLTRRERRGLAALARLLYSGAAWQTMKDYWGLSGAEAGEAASFGLTLLFDAARRRGVSRKGASR